MPQAIVIFFRKKLELTELTLRVHEAHHWIRRVVKKLELMHNRSESGARFEGEWNESVGSEKINVIQKHGMSRETSKSVKPLPTFEIAKKGHWWPELNG